MNITLREKTFLGEAGINICPPIPVYLSSLLPSFYLEETTRIKAGSRREVLPPELDDELFASHLLKLDLLSSPASEVNDLVTQYNEGLSSVATNMLH